MGCTINIWPFFPFQMWLIIAIIEGIPTWRLLVIEFTTLQWGNVGASLGNPCETIWGKGERTKAWKRGFILMG